MHRTLVIYASRYGPTEGAAKIISLILGPSRLTRPEGFAEGYRDVGFVVLGTHVYQGSVAQEMEAFVQDNGEWLKAWMPVLFCTCLDQKDGLRALGRLEGSTGWRGRQHEDPWRKAFPGKPS